MLTARRIETIASANRRRTAKFIANLLRALSWMITVITATMLFVLLVIVPPGLTVWAWALALAGTGVVGGLLLVVIEKYERIYLEKAGHGIRILADSGAKVEANTAVFDLPDRRAVVDTVRMSGLVPGGYAGRLAGVAYTRIRIEHRGNVPFVIQLPLRNGKQISFFNKDVYTQWRKDSGQKHFLFIPERVESNGHQIPTILPDEFIPKVTERVERILDVPDLTELKGVITVEPDQVLWLRRGDLLPQELLEKAVNVLADLAHRIEIEYSVFSLRSWGKSPEEKVYA